VDFSLTLSYETLKDLPEARALFALFADLPAGATEELLEAVLGEGWLEAVAALRRRSLLQDDRGRYTMLVPVREFAARTRTEAGEPLRGRLDKYLEGLAWHWGGDDRQWIPDDGTAVRRLTAELPNLHVALDRAAERGDAAFVARVTGSLNRFYAFSLVGAEAKQRLAAGARAARTAGDPWREAHCLQSLGEVHRIVAEYPQARAQYEEALPLCREVQDRLGEANCLQSLGRVHQMLAEYPQARKQYEDALRLYQEIGSRYDIAGTFSCLGLLCMAEGDMQEAVRQMEAAADLCESIGVTHLMEACRAQAEAWRGEP